MSRMNGLEDRRLHPDLFSVPSMVNNPSAMFPPEGTQQASTNPIPYVVMQVLPPFWVQP